MSEPIPGLLVDLAWEEATTAITLINRDPHPGEDPAPRDTAIHLEIVITDADPLALPGVNVLVDGVLAWAAEAPQPGFGGSAAGDAMHYRITLQPDVPFASGDEVVVRATGADAGGGTFDEVWSFTVEDVIAPALLGAQGWAQKVVRLTFDEPVLVADGVGFTFERLEAPGVDVAAVAAVVDAADPAVVDVTLNTEITPDKLYRVTVAGVTDTSGNPIVAPSNVADFAGYRPPVPAARRFDLWSMLPQHNRVEDTSGDLRKLTDVLQEVLDLLLASVDAFPSITSPDRCPAAFLEPMLASLGNPFDFDLTTTQRRQLATSLVALYRRSGLGGAIEDAARFFLGLEVVVEPLRRFGLILGESELSWPAVLTTEDPGPWDIGAGWSLQVDTGEGDVEVVIFRPGDAVNFDAITADEVAARIAADLRHGTAFVRADGRVAIHTWTAGEEATLEVTGGAAAGTFAFGLEQAAGGGDWELGSGDRAILYSFIIRAPGVVLTAAQRAQLATIADVLKPAHTHLIAIEDATPADTWDHWVLGESQVGRTSQLH